MPVDRILGALLDPINLQTLITGLVYASLVLTLNLEYGWTGIPNFGKVAFIAMGGIATYWVLSFYVYPSAAAYYGLDGYPTELGSYEHVVFMINYALPYLGENLGAYLAFMALSMALAMILGGVFGLAMAYPVARLREDYLAILLLMASFLVWNLLTGVDSLIGGSIGVRTTYETLKLVFGDVDLGRLVMTAAFFIAIYLIVDRLTHSPYGRSLRAVRDDETAAATMGKDVTRIRLQVIFVASMLAAMGGVIMILFLYSSANPDLFKPEFTFMLIAMMLLGGVGNNLGAVFGVFAFLYIFRAATALTAGNIPEGLGGEGFVRNMLTGILILLVLYFRPRGIIPETSVRTPAWLVFKERLGYIPVYARGILSRVHEGVRARYRR